MCLQFLYLAFLVNWIVSANYVGSRSLAMLRFRLQYISGVPMPFLPKRHLEIIEEVHFRDVIRPLGEEVHLFVVDGAAALCLRVFVFVLYLAFRVEVIGLDQIASSD